MNTRIIEKTKHDIKRIIKVSPEVVPKVGKRVNKIANVKPFCCTGFISIPFPTPTHKTFGDLILVSKAVASVIFQNHCWMWKTTDLASLLQVIILWCFYVLINEQVSQYLEKINGPYDC